VGVACDLYRTTCLLKVATRRGVVVVQAGPAKTVDGETYASIAADCRSLSLTAEDRAVRRLQE
jgi:hypothetical protein